MSNTAVDNSAVQSSSSATLTPSVYVVRENEGVYDVVVDTLAPNSCYVEDACAIEMPPGMDLSIPEYAHLVCKAKYSGGLDRKCLMYVKPLRWSCQDIGLGTGKSHLAVHVVVNGALAGSTVVTLPSNATK